MEKNEEELFIEMPDQENIPCKSCFWGQHNFLALYCIKYKIKPNEVYYKNVQCPNYKPIK